MRRLTGGASLAAFLAAMAFGQSGPAPMAFEVAAIKVRLGPQGRLNGFSSSGPHVTFLAYSVRSLLMEAYNLKYYQLSFAAPFNEPDYTYYDVVAKAEGDAPRTRAEFRQMLQALLAERFALSAHRDTQEMQVYALVVGKNGPKFKESAPDAAPTFLGTVNGRNQGVTATKLSMERLVQDLAIQGDRPVVDRTGLTGAYDIKFEATPQFRLDRETQPGDISVFDALQTQLGLKLESVKAQIEVLVVDHVEKPFEN